MNDVIQLNSGRKSFAVQRGEQIEQWSYDIVELKLCFEDLERRYPKSAGDKSNTPSSDLIKALASALSETYGLTGCTIDMAYQVYYIVSMQFNELHRSITEQVKSIRTVTT